MHQSSLHPKLTGWQIFKSFIIALLRDDLAAHEYVKRLRSKAAHKNSSG